MVWRIRVPLDVLDQLHEAPHKVGPRDALLLPGLVDSFGLTSEDFLTLDNR